MIVRRLITFTRWQLRTGLGLMLVLTSVPAAMAQTDRVERIADAKPSDLRVLATAAIRVPLEAVRANASAAIGRRLVIEYGSARGNLKDAVMAGAGFDVAMLLPDVDEQLLRAGKITASGVVIAKTPVAIGLRGDGTPDLGDPAAIKAAMLNAKSLRWSDTGAALQTVDKILDTLKIREAVRSTHDMASPPVQLRSGEYELNIYPLSEILANRNVRNLGPVVAQLQVPVVVTATISAASANVESARALIEFLRGPAIELPLKQNGFER